MLLRNVYLLPVEVHRSANLRSLWDYSYNQHRTIYNLNSILPGILYFVSRSSSVAEAQYVHVTSLKPLLPASATEITMLKDWIEGTILISRDRDHEIALYNP
ncbi:hypothetical protein AFLA_001548 [Aspergillus flavus NRRL3357]|nr:hypothetical protein AFLA_001548 [Aspergillus flavus NRRL3357]